MERIRTGLNKLLHPPKWVWFPVSPAVFAALAFVMITGKKDSMPVYLLYGMSAYCLTVTLLPLPGWVRGARAALVRQAARTAFGSRYLSDAAFRGSVSLWLGMLASFFYVALRTLVGIRHASVWSLSVAAYDLVLGALRLSLVLKNRHRERADEPRCYRNTAWWLLLLALPMGGMIVLMVCRDGGYSYPGHAIYLFAMYAFYRVIEAIRSLARFHRRGSAILSAAKAVSFLAALMSVLGLQTAMLTRFSVEEAEFRRMMNALTGGAVWMSTILTSVLMLRRCAKWKDEVEPLESIRE